MRLHFARISASQASLGLHLLLLIALQVAASGADVADFEPESHPISLLTFFESAPAAPEGAPPVRDDRTGLLEAGGGDAAPTPPRSHQHHYVSWGYDYCHDCGHEVGETFYSCKEPGCSVGTCGTSRNHVCRVRPGSVPTPAQIAARPTCPHAFAPMDRCHRCGTWATRMLSCRTCARHYAQPVHCACSPLQGMPK